MSDILVRCRHCGVLKSPRDVCICRLGEPAKPKLKPMVRVGLGIPLALPVDTGGFFGGRSLRSVISGLPSSVRYGLAGLGLMAAALLALALTGTPGASGDQDKAHALETASTPIQVLVPLPRGRSAPVYASIQSASGATVQVVWTSQETPQTARVLSSLVTPAQPPVAPGLGRPGTHTAAASASPDAPVFLDGSTVGGKSAGGSPSKASPSGSRSARGKPATPKKPANDKPDASAADKGSKATLTDLGTLGGEESVAYDLNEKGQVVGKSQTASGDWHAFLWKDGSMKDLGSLGGESCACAINEKGEVAGYSYVKGSSGACRAVRWSATGEMTTLSWLKDWVECRGGAIGDTGTVIGWAASEDTSQSAALMWTRDKAVPLPSDSASAAHGINAKNVVVGYEGFNGRRTAVTWHVGAKPTKLPDLGDGWSEARAVNADGHVVGFRQPTGGRACAFISRGGKLDELKNLDGYPMSVAQGINDSDQVVGYVWKGKDNDRTERAFVWRDGSMVDLNTLVTGDAVIQRARRINNHGQITAAALINGKAHACLVELG